MAIISAWGYPSYGLGCGYGLGYYGLGSRILY